MAEDDMREKLTKAAFYMKLGVSFLFTFQLGLIIESVLRFLVPSREKRPYVLTFYILASLLSVVCLVEGIYFAVHPSKFTKMFFHDFDTRVKQSAGELWCNLVFHMESSIVYALMVFVTCMMYHLNLTLRFIFISDGEKVLSSKQVKKRETFVFFAATIAILIYLLPDAVIIFINKGDERVCERNARATQYLESLEFSCIMSLLVCYSIVIFNLYSRIEHLKEMQEEKRAILT